MPRRVKLGKEVHGWFPSKVTLKFPHIPATFHQLGRREEAQGRQRRLILDLVAKIDGSRQSPAPLWGALSSEPNVTNLKKVSFLLPV